MEFDRYKLTQQPYSMERFIRTSHTPPSVYIDDEDAKYDPLLLGLGNNRGIIDSKARLARAERLVKNQPFTWGVFGPHGRSYVDQRDRWNGTSMIEVLSLLRKNRARLKEAVNYIDWFGDTGVYLAGGSIISTVYNEEVKDFDFFFRDKKTRIKFLQFLMAEGYSPVVVTNNAVTLNKDGCTAIQLISNHYYDYPEFAILPFDWSIAQCAIFLPRKEDNMPIMHFDDDCENNNLLGMAYVCRHDWSTHIMNRSMSFNRNSVMGSRHSSFFRALKYRQKYGITIQPWGFDHKDVTPSSLLSPNDGQEEMYGIPKPWESLWTAPDLKKTQQDVLGSVEDLAGSAYDNTMFLHFKSNRLIDSHRSVWSQASARRICNEMSSIMDSQKSGKYLPIDNSVVDETLSSSDYPYRMHPPHTIDPSSAIRQVINFCNNTTADKSFSLLLRAIMSMEVSCDKEFEEITKEDECQGSILSHP